MNEDDNSVLGAISIAPFQAENRLKVCHFSSVHHVWDSRVFYRECSGLAKYFDVTLIAIGENGNYIKNGVNVISIPKPNSFLSRFFNTIFKVFFLAVKQDAQLYHIHDAEMVPFGIILSILGKKVIYDIHENTHDDILLKPWLNPKIRQILASLYNGMLWLGAKFMHYIVVLGDPIYLPKFFVNKDNSTIIQNFADVDELEPYIINNRGNLPGNHLFYVGMIRDMYYDIDPVLEALYILKQKGVNCHLHLIGYFGAKTSKSFENLVFWDQIKSQITYYGFLEMKEAYEISKKCKIGLCIKNQPEQMLVSHERKLFEYMAIGLPSIFCKQTLYSNLNHLYQIGLAVDLENAQDISSAIFELIDSPEKINSLSQSNILASKNHINWKVELEKLRKLYFHLSNS